MCRHSAETSQKIAQNQAELGGIINKRRVSGPGYGGKIIAAGLRGGPVQFLYGAQSVVFAHYVQNGEGESRCALFAQ